MKEEVLMKKPLMFFNSKLSDSEKKKQLGDLHQKAEQTDQDSIKTLEKFIKDSGFKL